MPEFVEWMLGFPQGWTAGVRRNGRLRMLGNAVQVQCATAAGRWLFDFAGGLMTNLEVAARQAWRTWAVYQMHTFCHGCGGQLYCGARRRRGPWLCVDCYDQAAS